MMSKLLRFLMFKMKNRISFALLLLFLASCGQDYNSNTGDFAQYAPIEGIDSSTEDGTRLLATYKIFQAKCFQCHSWSAYKTSAAWVSAGLVFKGNSSASQVYTRLKNNGGDMPPDPIAELTAAELLSVETWINQMP